MTLIKPASTARHLSVRVKRPSDRRSQSRSATRALDVFELFGMTRRPLRAVEIARALELHASTANQLLKTMVDSGHLVFEARGKSYLPSPRLTGFAGWLVEMYGAGSRLHELIVDIEAQTGMVVTVSCPNDLFMQVIDLVVPEGQRAERGVQISLFGSAVGSACLAALADAEIVRLAHRARIPPTQVSAILEQVTAVRAAGHADGALDDSPYWSLAMPLPMPGGRGPTVLGLSGPSSDVRARLPDLCEIMRDAVVRWTSAPASGRETP